MSTFDEVVARHAALSHEAVMGRIDKILADPRVRRLLAGADVDLDRFEAFLWRVERRRRERASGYRGRAVLRMLREPPDYDVRGTTYRVPVGRAPPPGQGT